MNFDKDVFISYAHLDDKPLDEGAKGWITDFHKLLQTRLEQTIGKELNVWRDAEGLQGNSVFGPEIVAQFPKMKVMVSIITPRYVDSDWCRREMNEFYKAANQNGGVSIGNKSRIFKVIKTPVDTEVIQQLPRDIHKIFDEILDYKFYIREAATGKFKELIRGSWVDNKIQQEYMDKLDDVVQDIANLIKKLNNTGKADIAKKKIYLAETTYDLLSYRDNLVRELEENGYAVLPDKNLSNVIDKFNNEVESFISDCHLSIHLVSSTNYAAQPEGADKSKVILQNEIAAIKSGNNNLCRLIWIPPAIAATNGNEKPVALQKAFVDELKHNAEFQKGADILEGSIEELKFAIFDALRRIETEEKDKLEKIKEAEERAKQVAAAVASGPVADNQTKSPKIIYLICDKRDLETTRPLEDYLFDNGHEVIVPVFEGEVDQLTKAHNDNLKLCDAVILYYGNGNQLWFESMRGNLLGLPALGRTKALLSKTAYLADPTSSHKERFRSNDFMVINGLAGFTTDLFNDFIQKLK